MDQDSHSYGVHWLRYSSIPVAKSFELEAYAVFGMEPHFEPPGQEEMRFS